MCLAADRNDHNDYGKRFKSATMWLWYLLSDDDHHHRYIDYAESLSRPVPVSLEHGGLRLATDSQFVWAVWLYWSTNGNGNE